MADRLRGHVQQVEYEPSALGHVAEAHFILLGGPLIVRFRVVGPLVPSPGSTCYLVGNDVIDGEGRHHPVESTMGVVPTLEITDREIGDLHERARRAGVEADIVHDDMNRPVVVVRTQRGKIRRGCLPTDSWDDVLESVGLGGKV